MRIEKPASWNFIIKASAWFVWFLSISWFLGAICLLVYLWVLAEFVVSQVVIALSILILIFMLWSLKGLRIPTIVTTYDKIENKFTMEEKWIWKSRISEYPLSSVKNIQVFQKGKFGKNSLYYKIKVELDSGNLIAISSQNYRPEKRVRWIAKELMDFLAVD
jgi:hypothetical protein